VNIFESVILGIVEGLTEFLPISSTGHLILASRLMHLPNSEFLESFEIAIQLGAVLSVVFIYHRTLIHHFEIWKKILTAFFPTAVIGLLCHSFAKKYLLGNHWVVVCSLFAGGIFIIFFEKIYAARQRTVKEEISFTMAFLIGCAQSLAIIPGVSRSAATILAGLALGLGRKSIAEFSFLLAIPTMLAATALDLAKSGFQFTSAEWMVLAIGFVTSFVVAVFAVQFLLRFIRTHSFIPFGIYRVLIAVLFYFWM
jgi:undecaprenyl-diphosphatase